MANPTRLKHKFNNDTAREERRREDIKTLILDFSDKWGKGATVDLTSLNNRPDLAYSFALALFGLCEPDGPLRRFLSVKYYERKLKAYLWPFLDAHESGGEPHILSPRDMTPLLLQAFIDWLRLKELRSAYQIYLSIVVLLKHLRRKYPALVDKLIEIPKFPLQEVKNSVSHRSPYSEREAREIEIAARTEIRATILRLNRGAQLLSQGRDPRIQNDWAGKENLLWYVTNVLGGRYLRREDLISAGHGKLENAFNLIPLKSKLEIYSYLYPLISDLIPPLILISLQTGLNPQPIIDLRRDCLRAVPPPGKIGIVSTKYRGKPKSDMKVVDARSILSPGGIIRAFLKLTEACRPFVTDEDRDHLWIGLQNPRRGEPFKRLWRGRDVDREVKRFAARNKLMGDDGQPLALRLARLRPTWLTKRYKAGGNLAAVSRDANHAQAETTIAYINNTETQTIHEQTVAEGLNDFYRGVRERILTQCPDDPQQVANVARLVEATLEQAEAMLRGEQDTFISTCRDFYNRPGGPDNTPCDKPWSCFTCKNAYWTSRSLPGVIRFLDFMIDQRSLLAEGDWRAKFGIPYAVITDFILPAFPAESVDEARLTAEAEQFIVPITLKTI